MKYIAIITAISAVSLGITKLSAAELPNVDPQTTGSIEKEEVPTLVYKSIVQADGKVEVRLDENASNADPKKRDVLTIFAPNVRTTEKILHAQDWYMTVDSNGQMRGIYTVPRGNALPSSVLRNLGEGYGIMKVNPQNSFFKVFPSKYELASQLTTFTEAAHKSVCAQNNKPKSLTASMEVKPGWSASGIINFTATWDMNELCNTSSQPVAQAQTE